MNLENSEPYNDKPKRIHKVKQVEGYYHVEEPLSPEFERLKEETAKRVIELMREEIKRMFT